MALAEYMTTPMQAGFVLVMLGQWMPVWIEVSDLPTDSGLVARNYPPTRPPFPTYRPYNEFI